MIAVRARGRAEIPLVSLAPLPVPCDLGEGAIFSFPQLIRMRQLLSPGVTFIFRVPEGKSGTVCGQHSR